MYSPPAAPLSGKPAIGASAVGADGPPASDPHRHRQAATRVRWMLLLVWALAGFGGAYFARDLDALANGWPLGYWFAAQGSVLIFLAVVVLHAVVLNRMDAGLPDDLDDWEDWEDEPVDAAIAVNAADTPPRSGRRIA